MKRKDYIKKIEEMIHIQSCNGNYDYDEYNYGLLNGLAIAEATIKDEEPYFLPKPEKFIVDKFSLRKLTLENYLWCSAAAFWIIAGIIQLSKIL